jgi:hypothetical protein
VENRIHFRAEARALAVCAGVALHSEENRPNARGSWTFDRRLVTCWFCRVAILTTAERAAHYSRGRLIAERACGSVGGYVTASTAHVTCRRCVSAIERDERARKVRAFLASPERGDVWIDEQAPHVPARPVGAGGAMRLEVSRR